MSEEKPGRYQRTFGGLIGSMLVILVGVAAFVLFRELTREVPDAQAEPIEWRPAVMYAAETGTPVVHPRDLDPDWVVTSAEFRAGESVLWGMGMLTGDEEFVGLRQEDEDVRTLLDTYVDENAEEQEPVRLDSELDGEWRTFTDAGGDTAYVLERESDVVMVYGSASAEVLDGFVAQLTERVTDP